MKVLDLFAGLGGWSKPARERGHEVTTVDLDPRFGTDIVADVFDLTVDRLGGPGAYDLILASPPCEKFSVMTIGRNWYRDGSPKTAAAAAALRLVTHTHTHSSAVSIRLSSSSRTRAASYAPCRHWPTSSGAPSPTAGSACRT